MIVVVVVMVVVVVVVVVVVHIQLSELHELDDYTWKIPKNLRNSGLRCLHSLNSSAPTVVRNMKTGHEGD
jgi:hypothetical protein